MALDWSKVRTSRSGHKPARGRIHMPQNSLPIVAIDKLMLLVGYISDHAPGLTREEFCAFLYVAKHPGASVTDVQHYLKASQATASRIVSSLNHHDAAGHELIEASPAPEERRRMQLSLSDKGRRFIHGLARIISAVILLGIFLEFTFGPALHAADARPAVQLFETILQPFDCAIPNVLDQGDCSDHSIFDWGSPH